METLLKCGIFGSENWQHPLLRSAFIELLISLRDLMYKCEKYASRVSFSDDVQTTEKIRDVTDLIKYVRDAVCHPDSGNHYLEHGNIKATFNVAFGKAALVGIGAYEQSSPYEDDVCFFFGSQRIYLRRHVVRAFQEASSKLAQCSATSHRTSRKPPSAAEQEIAAGNRPSSLRSGGRLQLNFSRQTGPLRQRHCPPSTPLHGEKCAKGGPSGVRGGRLRAFDLNGCTRYTKRMGRLTDRQIQDAFELFGLGSEAERQRFRDLASLENLGLVVSEPMAGQTQLETESQPSEQE